MGGRKIERVRRRKSKIEPKVRFVLFCEGKNTEPAYFRAIKKRWAGSLVEIDTRAGVGVPDTIAQAAIGFAEKHGLLKKSRRRRK